jgi:hypothetical protein
MYIGKQRVVYAELPDDNVHDARAAMEEVFIFLIFFLSPVRQRSRRTCRDGKGLH